MGQTLKTDAPGRWSDPDGLVLEYARADLIGSKLLQSMYSFWVAKCAGRFAPTRAELEPRDFAPLLPSIHMYEVIDGGRAFRIKLLGAQIAAAAGGHAIGSQISEANIDPPGRRAFAIMRLLLQERRPIHAVAPRIASNVGSVMAVEAVWFPLSDDGININKVIACTIPIRPTNLN